MRRRNKTAMPHFIYMENNNLPDECYDATLYLLLQKYQIPISNSKKQFLNISSAFLCGLRPNGLRPDNAPPRVFFRGAFTRRNAFRGDLKPLKKARDAKRLLSFASRIASVSKYVPNGAAKAMCRPPRNGQQTNMNLHMPLFFCAAAFRTYDIFYPHIIIFDISICYHTTPCAKI